MRRRGSVEHVAVFQRMPANSLCTAPVRAGSSRSSQLFSRAALIFVLTVSVARSENTTNEFWPEARACSHYPEGFDDECKAEECEKDDVQFFKAGEDAAEAFEPAEQSFDLVAFFVKGAIVLPGLQPVGLRRNHPESCRDREPVAGFHCLRRRDPSTREVPPAWDPTLPTSRDHEAHRVRGRETRRRL
jgi:hypothetical protein